MGQRAPASWGGFNLGRHQIGETGAIPSSGFVPKRDPEEVASDRRLGAIMQRLTVSPTYQSRIIVLAYCIHGLTGLLCHTLLHGQCKESSHSSNTPTAPLHWRKASAWWLFSSIRSTPWLKTSTLLFFKDQFLGNQRAQRANVMRKPAHPCMRYRLRRGQGLPALQIIFFNEDLPWVKPGLIEMGQGIPNPNP